MWTHKMRLRGVNNTLKTGMWVSMMTATLAACAPRSNKSVRTEVKDTQQQSSDIYSYDDQGRAVGKFKTDAPIESGSLAPLGKAKSSNSSSTYGNSYNNDSSMMDTHTTGEYATGSDFSSSGQDRFAPPKPTKQAIPADGVHLVDVGETIYDISRTYNIDSANLIALNRLKPPYSLQAGQALYLNEEARRRETGVKLPVPAPSSVNKKMANASTSPDETAAALDDTLDHADKALKSGSEATPPVPVQKSAKKPEGGGSLDSVLGNLDLPSPLAGESTSSESSSDETTPTPPAKTSTATKTAKAEQPVQEAKPVSKMTVKSPVDGKVAAKFGQTYDGKKVNGLVYDGIENGLVKSVQAGQVMYVGEAKGYGQVVLVRHEGGVMTNYANLKNTLVKQGQKIEAGGLIGKIGKTDVSEKPHLIFEVREGSKAIDPEKYLR